MININNKIKTNLERKNIKETIGTLEKAGQNLLQIEAPKNNLTKIRCYEKIDYGIKKFNVSYHVKGKKVNYFVELNKDPRIAEVQKFLHKPELAVAFGGDKGGLGRLSEILNKDPSVEIKEGEIKCFQLRYTEPNTLKYLLTFPANLIGGGLGHYAVITRQQGELYTGVFTTKFVPGCCIHIDDVDFTQNKVVQYLRIEKYVNMEYFIKEISPLERPVELEFIKRNEKKISDLLLNSDEMIKKDIIDSINFDVSKVSKRMELINLRDLEKAKVGAVNLLNTETKIELDKIKFDLKRDDPSMWEIFNKKL